VPACPPQIVFFKAYVNGRQNGNNVTLDRRRNRVHRCETELRADVD